VTTNGVDVTLVDPVLEATPMLRSLNVTNDHHTSPSKHTPEHPSDDVHGIFHGDDKHVLPSYDPGDVHMPAYGKPVTLVLNERSILSSTVDQFIQHLTFDELIRSNKYNSEYDGFGQRPFSLVLLTTRSAGLFCIRYKIVAPRRVPECRPQENTTLLGMATSR
jgi:hypothetical protein